MLVGAAGDFLDADGVDEFLGFGPGPSNQRVYLWSFSPSGSGSATVLMEWWVNPGGWQDTLVGDFIGGDGVDEVITTATWGTQMMYDMTSTGMYNTVSILPDSYFLAAAGAFICDVANAPPVAVCQDITVYLDEYGEATIEPEDVDGGSYDDDEGDEIALSIDVDTFDCDDLGENVVVLTVEDLEGETDTCEAVVTVVDEIDPVIEGCGLDVIRPGRSREHSNSSRSGYRQVVAGEASDNCGIESIVCTMDGVEVEDGELVKITKAPGSTGTSVNIVQGWYKHIVGPTGELVCTATDTSGNTDTCTADADVPPME
jgi:hypothetical protein